MPALQQLMPTPQRLTPGAEQLMPTFQHVMPEGERLMSVVGEPRTESDGVHSRTLQAVTIDLHTGALQTVDLRGEDAAAR